MKKTSFIIAALLLYLSKSANAGNLISDHFDSFYFGTEVAATRLNMEAGGRNTEGNFNQSDYNNEDSVSKGNFGIKAGVNLSKLRFDLSWNNYATNNFITQSCQTYGPCGGSGSWNYYSKVNITRNFMVGGAYDFYTLEKVKFFAGAGLGVADIKFSAYDAHDDGSGEVVHSRDNKNTNFVWQLNAGANYTINKNIDLEGKIQYKNFGDISGNLYTTSGSSAGNYTIDLDSWDLVAGLRYNFR